MTKVVARASAPVPASPDRVLAFLRDYREGRQRILTENFTAYRVEQGGTGEGTVYAYHFAAGGRERDYRLHVHEHEGGLDEDDQLSSFRSVWTVLPASGGSTVTIEATWDGAGGIGGFFERMFAPLGLRRIYAQMLSRLQDAVAAGASTKP